MLLRLLINGDGLRKVDSKCGRFLPTGPNERSGTDRTGLANERTGQGQKTAKSGTRPDRLTDRSRPKNENRPHLVDSGLKILIEPI